MEASVTSYLGIQIVNLGADEKAELLFVDQLYELLSLIPSATLCFFFFFDHLHFSRFIPWSLEVPKWAY